MARCGIERTVPYHVDVLDDAAQARVCLFRRQPYLQHEAVHLVDHQAHLHLRGAVVCAQLWPAVGYCVCNLASLLETTR